LNSAQRRKERRKFLRENAEEIQKLIDWINGPEVFESSYASSDGQIEMAKKRMEAFGYPFPQSKSEWKEYLIKKGVDSANFIDPNESSDELPKLPCNLKITSQG